MGMTHDGLHPYVYKTYCQVWKRFVERSVPLKYRPHEAADAL